MAAANISVARDQFCCSICLDILKDPVAIPCGHSYCMDCIEGCWDQDDQRGVYKCPQCRQTFFPRPVLNRNTMLAELVEKLKTGLQAAPPAHYYAGPEDVEFDVCTGRKSKAVESCLVCLASYCETHLQPHRESAAFKKHKLVKVSTQLQQKICSHHDKLLEIYCRTDQQCICYLCTMDEHKGHDTVSAAAERNEKQNHVKLKQETLQQKIKDKLGEIKKFQKAIMSLKHSAQTAVLDSERIFIELIRSIEGRRSEVKELIRAQEKVEVSRAEELLERLEQEVAELWRRDSELEQLSHTENPIDFLQRYKDHSNPPLSEVLSTTTINPGCDFGRVKKSMLELKMQLESYCKEEVVKITLAVQAVQMLQTIQVGR
ncbi:tripartite motif-containing protein 29-like [Coregonus clupeaformis]|uniref:tripartite motif-containing protein 29-like n=1 Tax=Coregonus clupeaformis TaxID=59861 RepID=UPI001BE0333A|nr:tripartite motif-containing protein 29-like [Coregonus clupeaformis]